MNKPRVFITTDIHCKKNSEYDDIQSLAHLLWYSDMFDIVGISCSHPGGKREAARRLIRAYEKDWNKYDALVKHQHPNIVYSRTYAGQPGKRHTPRSNGVQALILASKEPLFVLVWGACTDLASALRHADFKPENCVAHVIGSWNRLQDEESYEIVHAQRKRFKRIVFSESTFRGVYYGTPEHGKFGTKQFLARLKKCGRLGACMYAMCQTAAGKNAMLKMGDTGSTFWLLDRIMKNKPAWGSVFPDGTDSPKPEHRLGPFEGARPVHSARTKAVQDWGARMQKYYGV